MGITVVCRHLRSGEWRRRDAHSTDGRRPQIRKTRPKRRCACGFFLSLDFSEKAQLSFLSETLSGVFPVDKQINTSRRIVYLHYNSVRKWNLKNVEGIKKYIVFCTGVQGPCRLGLAGHPLRPLSEYSSAYHFHIEISTTWLSGVTKQLSVPISR